MKKLLLLFSLLPLFTIGQNIKGTIISEKNESPVADANIIYLSLKLETTSNEKGEFNLILPSNIKKNDTIQITHIGFTEKKITFEDFKKQNYKITLFEEVENLNEVKLTANHPPKLKSKLAFEKVKSIPHGISSYGSFLLDDKIYVFGGDGSLEFDIKKRMQYLSVPDDQYLQRLLLEQRFSFNSNFFNNKLFIYDIKNDTWDTSEVKFKKRAFHSLNYYDGKFYLLGGKKPSYNGKLQYLENEIEVFDVLNQTVTIDKTNPHQASNTASFTYQDNIILLGGSVKMTDEGKKTFSDKMHFYNIKSGYWYELPKMITPKETSGILLDNTIYLFGGDNGTILDSIETFDLRSEKWTTIGALFTPLERPAITAQNNTIFLFDNNNIIVYDIQNRTLKQYRVEIGITNAAIHYYNNKLYIISGRKTNDYSKFPSKEVFSINLEEFDTTKPEKIKTLSKGLAAKS